MSDRPAELVVVSGRGEVPFSEGLLAQSLLATGIDPHDAFRIGRQIERSLHDAGTRAIDRHDLRALASRVLREEAGDEIAERYRLWRRHQEPERPVVVLLGGTSGVGKTAIALEVARRLGIGRVLSTDSIRQIMRALLSAEVSPALYGSSYDVYTRLATTRTRPPTVIEGFLAQASAVSVGVRASLDRTVEESAHLVMDGVSLVPGLLDLGAWAELATVVFLLVVVSDEEALGGRFAARHAAEPRRAPHRYLENLDGILAIQRHLIQAAERAGVPIVDNTSFEGSVRAVLDRVMESLRAEESRLVRSA